MTTTINLCGATITVEDEGELKNDRPAYRYTITIGDYQHTDSDLCGPACGSEPTTDEMMETLLSFLGACGESYAYPNGENADLFPEPIAEWAAENSDEIGMLRWEIEEPQEDH